MPRRPHQFAIGGFYHIFNRGVEKRDIFLDDTDRYQLLLALAFYQQVHTPTRLSLADFHLQDRQPPLRFRIHAYCLIDNHFHLLVEQVEEDGVRQGVRHVLDSYARYFNRRRNRVGSLFQGRFRSVPIMTNEQLVHVARYIFLNPYIAGLENRVGAYPWNGYQEYLTEPKAGLCERSMLLSHFQGDVQKLQNFVEDHASYARSLQEIKELVLE